MKIASTFSCDSKAIDVKVYVCKIEPNTLTNTDSCAQK